MTPPPPFSQLACPGGHCARPQGTLLAIQGRRRDGCVMTRVSARGWHRAMAAPSLNGSYQAGCVDSAPAQARECRAVQPGTHRPPLDSTPPPPNNNNIPMCAKVEHDIHSTVVGPCAVLEFDSEALPGRLDGMLGCWRPALSR